MCGFGCAELHGNLVGHMCTDQMLGEPPHCMLADTCSGVSADYLMDLLQITFLDTAWSRSQVQTLPTCHLHLQHGTG